MLKAYKLAGKNAPGNFVILKGNNIAHHRDIMKDNVIKHHGDKHKIDMLPLFYHCPQFAARFCGQRFVLHCHLVFPLLFQFNVLLFISVIGLLVDGKHIVDTSLGDFRTDVIKFTYADLT